VEEFSKIIKKRSTPGTLILDMQNRLVYSNGEAFRMLSGLQKNSRKKGNQDIPREISDLCDELKKKTDGRAFDQRVEGSCKILNKPSGPSYSMRAFFIGRDQDRSPIYIMVLLEKIIRKHHIDFENAKRRFKLSRRELQVVKLICDGLTNREVGEKMFICEYTVKDHIKNIMRKMEVISRSQIMSFLNRR
jgi:DNA-binding CsgD family transcriptional regulator